MKLEHRTKWVEALRSGEYLQGRGFLKVKRQDGEIYYCCIGVFCEVNKADFQTTEDFETNGTSLIYRINENSSYVHGPLIMRETGLTEGIQYKLSDMNDSAGKTFLEIANWIEANIEADTDTTAGTSETI